MDGFLGTLCPTDIFFLSIGDRTWWSAPDVSSNVTAVSGLQKAQPVRVNLSRWDPVLAGLVQGGGRAAK